MPKFLEERLKRRYGARSPDCVEDHEQARIHARQQSNAKGSSRRAQARRAYGKLTACGNQQGPARGKCCLVIQKVLVTLAT